MSRSIKILFGLGVALMVLSGPAFLVGLRMVYTEVGSYPLEGSLTDYVNSLLATWVAPPLIRAPARFIVGVNLVVIGLIAWYYQRQKRPAATDVRGGYSGTKQA